MSMWQNCKIGDITHFVWHWVLFVDTPDERDTNDGERYVLEVWHHKPDFSEIADVLRRCCLNDDVDYSLADLANCGYTTIKSGEGKRIYGHIYLYYIGTWRE